tara:strand:+ start:239 stop:427 length:189 start_codon:yes stop_codon:yes gene_type:complete
MLSRFHSRNIVLTAAILTFGLITSGCERKEKVLDVETSSGGGVEVERNLDTGAVTVDVDDAN